MSNLWMKKNPFMSMWLSSSNSLASSARGRLTAEAKRQSRTAITKATNDIFGMWAEAMTSAANPKKKKVKR